MKTRMKLALSTALVATIAVGGPAFSLIHSSSTQFRYPEAGSRVLQRSVIKVHTDHGVITLPGTADSWDAAENAIFVADSIADVQMVNNEIPWRISFQ
jgi:BON domain